MSVNGTADTIKQVDDEVVSVAETLRRHGGSAARAHVDRLTTDPWAASKMLREAAGQLTADMNARTAERAAR